MQEIECPSGLKGVIRRLKGSEGKLLADRHLARAGTAFDLMLRNCWTETIDSGPYPHATPGAGSQPDWRRVLLGDRFHALIQIRIASFGSEYTFDVRCGARDCGEKYEVAIQLQDLPVKTLSDASRQIFQGDNRFETEAAGRRVVYRLATGQEEAKLAALRRQNRNTLSIIDALAVRIIEADGCKHDGQVRAWLEDLDLSDLTDMLDTFDANDCGVETKVETVCDLCGWGQEIALPFEGDFFLPRKKRSIAAATTTTRDA